MKYRKLRVAALPFVVLVATAGPVQAQTETGPWFEPPGPGERAYELRLSTAVDYASRSDFSEPVVLFRNRVERMRALQLSGRLDVRLWLTPVLSLQLVAPLVFRSLHTQLDGVLVSQTEQLPDRQLQLQGLGLSDPTLAAAYHLGSAGPLGIFVDAGAKVPVDDNPGSNTLAERVPPGAGQGQVFAGVGAHLRALDWSASLALRLAYLPRSTVTYLVRRVDDQAYASGALQERVRSSWLGRVSYQPLARLELSLAPRLSLTEAPIALERGLPVPIIPQTWLLELNLRAAVRWRLTDHHALELFYRQPLVETWRRDPLFPLAMPEQGGGIMWLVSGS